MIVEDDLAFSVLLERAIKKFPDLELIGHYANTISFATNIEKKKPDILLLDINIPGLDGPEVMELVTHQPKIIMVSVHPESKMDQYKIDYDYYLQKPLRNTKVLEGILKACMTN